eukprot:TRINITY_DN41755_c0_g1_i1.p1 TRINITY_DN41755_c0_g1~~TRINITY_DN41755_c0_g1_i1.p1  ORF type:complete len:158 (-),score=36.92 TRINITY_DN41755_c0_g1_i1:201-674(-)
MGCGNTKLVDNKAAYSKDVTLTTVEVDDDDVTVVHHDDGSSSMTESVGSSGDVMPAIRVGEHEYLTEMKPSHGMRSVSVVAQAAARKAYSGNHLKPRCEKLFFFRPHRRSLPGISAMMECESRAETIWGSKKAFFSGKGDLIQARSKAVSGRRHVIF